MRLPFALILSVFCLELGLARQVEPAAKPGYESITASGNTTPDASWTGVINSGTSINTMTAGGSYPHTGTDYAYMGVNASTSQQTLTSAATTAIPSTATQATLSFWVSIVTSETGTTAYDTLKVNLLSSTGTGLATLGTLSNANSTGGAGTYVQKSYNILSYKGQAVKVQFVANTDSSLATTFRIDDVSVKSD